LAEGSEARVDASVDWNRREGRGPRAGDAMEGREGDAAENGWIGDGIDDAEGRGGECRVEDEGIVVSLGGAVMETSEYDDASDRDGDGSECRTAGAGGWGGGGRGDAAGGAVAVDAAGVAVISVATVVDAVLVIPVLLLLVVPVLVTAAGTVVSHLA
jgi:hypothetical protein